MDDDEENPGGLPPDEEEAVGLMEDPTSRRARKDVPTRKGRSSTSTTTISHSRSRSPRQKMTHRPTTRGGGGETTCCCWVMKWTCLTLLTVIVIGSVGFLTYYQDAQSPKFQLIPGDEEDDVEMAVSNHLIVSDQLEKNSYSLSSQESLTKLLQDLGLKVVPVDKPVQTVRYDLNVKQYNPFQFNDQNIKPFRPLLTESIDDLNSVGYLQMPHLVKNQLVFCSQGDVFITLVDPEDRSKPIAASRLTTTVGNVLDPRLHPTLRYVAYTATYSGRRDIYLMDLAGGKPATRLTYWETGLGVSGLVGWWGTSSLVFRATSNEVSLPDTRLYVLHLEDDEKDGALRARGMEVIIDKRTPTKGESLSSTKEKDLRANSMLQIDPIPLSQARDAARYEDCWYFVRYAQSSRTIRYVGGTAEQLYRYCDGASKTDRLFARERYDGTSKSPQMYKDTKYLFFLSDRGRQDGGTWIPDRMNVWAMPLSKKIEDHTAETLIQITDTACDFEGRLIQEFSVDSVTGHMVVRIGADLYWMTASDIRKKLTKGRRRVAEGDDAVTDTSISDSNLTLAPLGDEEPIETSDHDKDNATITPDNTTVPLTGEETIDLSDPDKDNATITTENTTLSGEETVDTSDHDQDNATISADNVTLPLGGEETDDTSDHDKDNTTLGADNTTQPLGSEETIDTSDHDKDNATLGADNTTQPLGGEKTIDTSDPDKDNATIRADNITQPVDASPADKDNTTISTDNNTLPLGGDEKIDTSDADSADTTPLNTSSVNASSIDTSSLNTSALEANDTVTRVYFSFDPPELLSRITTDTTDHFSGSSTELSRLPIVVHSDFDNHQERIIPLELLGHITSGDVYETASGSLSFIATFRGQLWVLPVVEDIRTPYGGAGRNMPERRYRLAPGANMGGAVRILAVVHVPNPVEDDTSDRRLAVILATDPLSGTGEQAFYLIETQSGVSPSFLDMDHLPKPFLGGHLSGGSTKDGGLGSIEPGSVTVSPCGRRMAWTDRDGRILVMNLPQYQRREIPVFVVLPKENEMGEPMVGETVNLVWSPAARYLAVEHSARNQFSIISIVDLGDPQGEDKVSPIAVGRIVQATPSRFNSMSPYWSKSNADRHAYSSDVAMAKLLGSEAPSDVAATLFYLSDRDINTDVRSPWGTRQPMPHFKPMRSVFALPLYPKNSTSSKDGPYGEGGATEAKIDSILARQQTIKTAASARRRRLLRDSLAGAFGVADDVFAARRASGVSREVEDTEKVVDDKLKPVKFPVDMDIDFFGEGGDRDMKFARQSYRIATIPEGNYVEILSHTPDDGSFAIVAVDSERLSLMVFQSAGYPSDQYTAKTFSPTSRKLQTYGRSACRNYVFLVFSPDGQTRIVENTGSGFARLMGDSELDDNIVPFTGLHLNIWPELEYRQMYDDAWRMLRDYFYDPELTGIDWQAIHERYLPLVSRCAKREELDDVLAQMASELSALHVFVYGGEKNSPTEGRPVWSAANEVASLAATFKRSPAWKGYQILSIAQSDPDFDLVDGSTEIYSPLSEKTLRLSGQRGVMPGDVIVGVNGNSVMNVPDIHMLLRGQAGSSVRLDILRLASGNVSMPNATISEVPVEPLIVVPIASSNADDLRYSAWEWKTRQLAEQLANENGFSVGYIHLQDMSGPHAENAFARGFFPNYHKEALILDVRHNRGGNIDSWVLDVLQRKAWMYWQSRDFTTENGGLGWDEHFAFRGHIVVLIDEKTSSDGEGVARGISELGIGRLIGTRTWGGGIWLASDNVLVDGGIATAPEIGTFNDHFGWGLGIEQMGVRPDLQVDNDPHESYEGKDTQLETAILELKRWLEEEPIVIPKAPDRKRDMTMGERECRKSS